jgi:hypothetical protein
MKNNGHSERMLRLAGQGLTLCGLVLALGQTAAAQQVVGGITPAERPAHAPRITQTNHDQAWYRRALTGVSKPYPQTLSFLDHQGDWYTPFIRPGMPNFYDLRRWHSTAR